MLVCIIFAIMAYFYTYIDPTKIEAQFAQKDPEEKERRRSLEMARKDLYEHYKEDSSDEEEDKKTKM